MWGERLRSPAPEGGVWWLMTPARPRAGLLASADVVGDGAGHGQVAHGEHAGVEMDRPRSCRRAAIPGCRARRSAPARRWPAARAPTGRRPGSSARARRASGNRLSLGSTSRRAVPRSTATCSSMRRGTTNTAWLRPGSKPWKTPRARPAARAARRLHSGEAPFLQPGAARHGHGGGRALAQQVPVRPRGRRASRRCAGDEFASDGTSVS